MREHDSAGGAGADHSEREGAPATARSTNSTPLAAGPQTWELTSAERRVTRLARDMWRNVRQHTAGGKRTAPAPLSYCRWESRQPQLRW